MNDLSEMTSEIKNLLVKFKVWPQGKQTPDSFIEEEKEFFSAGKADFANWVKVAPFLLLQNKSFNNGTIDDWPEGPGILAEYEDLKSKMNTEEKKEVSADVSVDNSTIETPDDAPKEIPKRVTIEDSIVNTKVFATFSRSRSIKTTNKEKCFYTFEQFGRPEDRQFGVRIDYPKIKSFNNIKDYILNFEELIDRLSGMVELVVNQPEEIETGMNNFWEHTSWSSVGFNIPSILSKISNPQLFKTIMNNDIFPKESKRKKIMKKYFSCTDRFSRLLEKLAFFKYPIDQYLKDTPKLISLFRSFFRHYLSNGKKYLKTMEENYRPEYTAWNFVIPDQINLDTMLEISPVIRTYITNFLKERILKRVILSKSNEMTTFKEIMTVLTVRLQENSTKNPIAARLVSKAPEDFTKLQLFSHLFGKYTRVSYVPKDPRVYDPLVLTDCLLMRLFLSKKQMDPFSVLQINNYIFYNLISKFKCLRGVNLVAAYDPNVDLFNTYIHTVRPAGLRNAIEVFLRSWCDEQIDVVEKVPSKFINIMGRKNQYFLPFGEYLNDNSEIYAALLRFNKFLLAITDSTLYITSFSKHYAILRDLLMHLESKFKLYSLLAYKLTDTIRVLSALPYCRPMANSEYSDDLNVYPISPKLRNLDLVLETGLVTSYAVTAAYSEVEIDPVSIEDVFDAMNLAGYLNNVASRYDFAKKTFNCEVRLRYGDRTLKMFTFQDHLNYAFSGMEEFKAPSSFVSLLKEEFSELKCYGYTMVPVMSADIEREYKIRNILKEYVNKFPLQFGFSNSFIISPFHTKFETKNGLRLVGKHSRGIESDQLYFLSSHRVEDYIKYNLISIMKGLEENHLHKDLQKHLEQKRAILIEHPTPVVLKKFFFNPNAVEKFPLVLEENQTAIRLAGPVEIYYDIPEEYVYVYFQKPEPRRFPNVLIDLEKNFPFDEYEGHDILKSSMKMVKRYTGLLKFIDEKDVFQMMFFLR